MMFELGCGVNVEWSRVWSVFVEWSRGGGAGRVEFQVCISL